MKKAIDRDPPLQDNIDKEFEDNLIKPFKTPSGAVVTQTSSVSLLNRYCMSLPADQFTISAVTWSKSQKRADEITVKVLLPIQSTLKGEIMVSFHHHRFLSQIAKRISNFKGKCTFLRESGVF